MEYIIFTSFIDGYKLLSFCQPNISTNIDDVNYMAACNTCMVMLTAQFQSTSLNI